MPEQDNHNIEVPEGSLRLKGLKPNWKLLAEFYRDNTYWRILAATLTVLSLLFGYAVGGLIGLLVGAVIAVIIDIIPAFHREKIVVERHG